MYLCLNKLTSRYRKRIFLIFFYTLYKHNWQRVLNHPILRRTTPLYCLPSPFFKILTNPTCAHVHTHTHTHTQYLSLFLLPCFFDWMGDCATSDIILLYDLDLHKPWNFSITRTLQCVLCKKFFPSPLIWHHTQTKAHSTHRGQLKHS